MTAAMPFEFDPALLSPTVTEAGAAQTASADGFTNSFWEEMTNTTVGGSFFAHAEAIEASLAETEASFWKSV